MQKKEVAAVNAAVQLGIGALCLWRGFKDEDK